MAGIDLTPQLRADLSKAITERDAAKKATTEALAANAAYIQRCKDIMSLPEAVKRKEAAFSIMTDTELNTEQAAKMLSMMPEQPQAAASNQFAEHMARLGNPQIGLDLGDDEQYYGDQSAEQLLTHIAKHGA